MSESSDQALLRRFIEFELALERDSSEIVEEFDWGRLIHNPATPAMWSGNYLEVHAVDLGADALVAIADEAQGPLPGVEHRDIVPADPDHGDRLSEGFEALDGWDVMRSVYMVLTREPGRQIGPAKETERAAVAGIRRGGGRGGPGVPPPGGGGALG